MKIVINGPLYRHFQRWAQAIHTWSHQPFVLYGHHVNEVARFSFETIDSRLKLYGKRLPFLLLRQLGCRFFVPHRRFPYSHYNIRSNESVSRKKEQFYAYQYLYRYYLCNTSTVEQLRVCCK